MGEKDNRRLTDADISQYLSTGERQHVRDQKGKQLDSGGSPILTEAAAVRNFIQDSLSGKIRNTIKGYGMVGSRFAGDVSNKSGGAVNISGYYLELDSNRLAHLSDHVEQEKDSRNIPLTSEQVQRIPDYIDGYDDLIDIIARKDGSVRLMLGKRINGTVIVIEAVSKGRKALHPVTAYQIPTEQYENYYKKRAADRSSTPHIP